jgi:hypothetical protein
MPNVRRDVTWGLIRRFGVEPRLESCWKVYKDMGEVERKLLDELVDCLLVDVVKARNKYARFSHTMALELFFQVAMWKEVNRDSTPEELE